MSPTWSRLAVMLQSRWAAVTPGGGVLYSHPSQSLLTLARSKIYEGDGTWCAHVNVDFVDSLGPLIHCLACNVQEIGWIGTRWSCSTTKEWAAREEWRNIVTTMLEFVPFLHEFEVRHEEKLRKPTLEQRSAAWANTQSSALELLVLFLCTRRRRRGRCFLPG